MYFPILFATTGGGINRFFRMFAADEHRIYLHSDFLDSVVTRVQRLQTKEKKGKMP